MPELPEVEAFRQLLVRHAVGKKILCARVAEDSLVLERVAPQRLRQHLEGNSIQAAKRVGKFLWCELSHGPHPVLHMGMTGRILARGESPLQLESLPRETLGPWPPKHCILELELAGGAQIAMTSTRRIARVRLQENPEEEDPIRQLGPDLLRALPSAAELTALLEGKRKVLKSALLDQTLVAGLGNWLVDDILYDAALDPRRPAGSLVPEDCEKLRTSIEEILSTACAVDANSALFPAHWLFHLRWTPAPGVRTARGETVEFMQVGGRTTAWVPARQRSAP